MWWIKCSRMAHASQQWPGINLAQIYRKCSLSTSPRENIYYTKAVIKSTVNVSKRLLHVTRCLEIKEKDEYYANLALKETRTKELVSQEFFEESTEYLSEY